MSKRIIWKRINSDPFDPEWVCPLCYPYMLDIGWVRGIGELVYNKHTKYDSDYQYGSGRYAILDGYGGHSEGEVIWFDEKPKIEKEGNFYYYFPSFNLPLENVDMVIDAIKLLPKNSSLYKKFKDKKEYGFYGGLIHEFFIRNLHNLIKRWERKFGNVEEYYENVFFPKRYQRYLEELKNNGTDLNSFEEKMTKETDCRKSEEF